VNAVVNMTGVVDADALSGNGAGGSVLVTSTGDINLGGTITAQGNGTGAGGSIVTKAAGRDNIESGANLLAAGGADGKGGFIDVSGHNVKLDGNIDPGKGGELLLDPANITVVSGAGANSQSASIVNETWLANELQQGVSVNLQATHDIIFKGHGPASNFVLYGGSGNLLANAGEDIITSDVGNYEIRTGNGNVTLTAGHDIDGNHLSIVSGWANSQAVNPVGPDYNYNNVTQAGDIVLKAGNNLTIDNITVKTVAADGVDNALFTGSAAANLDILGNIDVEASNTGHNAVARATVDLIGKTITVDGNITVNAFVDNANGTVASAVANLQVITVNQPLTSGTLGDIFSNVPAVNHLFNSHTVNLDGAVTVEARADGHFVIGNIHATAEADITGSHITVNGPARVTAFASGEGDVVIANAQLVAELGHGDFTSHFSTNGVSFSVNGHANVGAQDVRFNNTVTVLATADASNGAVAEADAFAHLAGASVDVAGLVTVNASARAWDNTANANARLLVDFADASATIDIFRNSTASANAVGNAVHQFASAISGHFFGLDFGLHHIASDISHANIGAHDEVFSGSNNATLHPLANFIAIEGHGHVGGTNVNLQNGITVEALANGYSFGHNNAAPAHAHATATVAAEFISFGSTYGVGRVTVNAEAFGGSIIHSVTADAKLLTDKASLSIDAHIAHYSTQDGSPGLNRFVQDTGFLVNAHVGGDQVVFGNGFQVTAHATGERQTGKISADASVHLVAGVSSTNDPDETVINAAPGVYVFGPAIVKATATGHGTSHNAVGGVHADANLLADAFDLTIATNYLADPVVGRIIIGNRNDVGGGTIDSLTGLGGFNNVSFEPTIVFSNGVDVEAHAHGNYVDGSVTARADAKLYGRGIYISTFDGVGGPVTVKASANESYGTKDGGVHASAGFVAAGSAFHVSGTTDQILEASIYYNGDITIGADEVIVGSNISVTAFADPRDGNAAVTANALVHLAAHDVFDFGNITDHATALGSGNEANAEARLVVDYADIQFNASFTYLDHAPGALSYGVYLAGALVSYVADRFFGTGGLNLGLYNAADIIGDHTYDSAFGVHLGIDAHLGGSYDALNGVDVQAIANAHLTTANGDLIGDAAAHALALATIAGESIQIHGPVKVIANAQGGDGTGHPGSSFGHSSVTAKAKLTTDLVGIGVDVSFPSFSGAPGSYGPGDNTTLKLEAHIGGHFVGFSSGLDVEAHASGEDIFKVNASAEAHLVAGTFATYGNVEPAILGNNFFNIVVNGPAIVHASANGFDAGVVGADAHLLVDVADVKLSATFDGTSEESLGRLVIGGLYASSQHLNNFITGNRNSGDFPNLVIEDNMLFQDGVDVQGNAYGLDVDIVDAVASAELYGHDIGVNGQTNVFAHATHDGSGGYEVDAIANLTVAADVMEGSSYNGVHHNFITGTYASIRMGSSYNGGGGGTINVGAFAKGSYLGGEGTAEADANVRLVAEDEIYVGGPINVTASATGHDGDRVIADAQFAAFGFAGSHSYGSYFDAFREGAGFIFLDPDLNVTAKASGNGIDSVVEASAQGLLAAEYIRVDGNVNVMATASGTDARHVRALANLIAEGASYGSRSSDGTYQAHIGFGSVNFLRPIDVQAKAIGSSDSTIEASAAAQFYDRNILVQDQVTVKATASNSGDRTVNDVRSRARLIAAEGMSSGHNNSGSYEGNWSRTLGGFASVDNYFLVNIDFEKGIDVQAVTNGQSIDGVAEASAFVHLAGQNIAVDGNITVLASATGHGSGSTADSRGSAVFARSGLFVDGGSYYHHSDYGYSSLRESFSAHEITLGGAIDVEAHAKGTAMQYSIEALATVHLLAATYDGFGGTISVAGPIKVLATAVNNGFDTEEVDGVRARAYFVTGSYINVQYWDHGYYSNALVEGENDSVTLAKTLDVEAMANGGNLGSTAEARSVVALTGYDVTVDGNVTEKASATGHGFTYGTYGSHHHNAGGVFAEAALYVADGVQANFSDYGRFHDSSVHELGNASSVTMKGNVDVTADARGNRISGSFDGAVDNSFDGAILASAEFSITAVRTNLEKNLNVMATAKGTSVDGAIGAFAHASLESYYDQGLVNVNGQITVLANAVGNNSSYSFADWTVVAAAGLDVDGESMTLNGISVTANASGMAFDYVHASAYAHLGDSTNSDTGSLTVRRGINVAANARGTDVAFVDAEAEAELYAGSIAVSGNIRVAGLAKGNGVESIDGSARIEAGGGNLFFGGTLNALGRADVSNTFDGYGAYNAHAEAVVDLEAGSSMTIFAPGTHGPGITASAIADSQNEANHAWAGAFIHAHAATDGTGNLFIKGNMTAHAVAIATGDGNTALAFQNLTAQNITLIGNIRSLAFADGSNDTARAGVAMDADIIPDPANDSGAEPHTDSTHGQILIIGDAPIASAIAGTAHARRQAAYSTEQNAYGNSGSHAFADIDIEGSEAVVVTPTTDQQLRLLTLETLIPNPPWASSSLSEILLTVQDHKCGVLGGAGNPNGDNKSCEKRPFHIADTDVDTLP
jgi:hypothetical protein